MRTATKSKVVNVGDIKVGGDNPLLLIAGPCVIEDENSPFDVARRIKKIATNLSIPFVFKSSYLKDNRSSIHSFTGIGVRKGLSVLKRIKEDLDIPVCSDIHSAEHVDMVRDILDIIQIPAFLSRQTSVIVKAASTGKAINVKKGQFLTPYDMKYVIEKIESVSNHNILLTERGSCFGYFNIVNDFRAVPIMKKFGYPIIYDATHSVRKMGIPSSDPEGADKEFIPDLVRAAVAVGSDGVFVESHLKPEEALSDACSQVSLEDLEHIMKDAKTLHEVINNQT